MIPSKPKRKPKYNNVKVEFDGYVFDSIKERDRFITLRFMLGAKEISDLIHQPEFVLLEDKEHPTFGMVRGFKYIADFSYIKNGVLHVEDVKSKITAEIDSYILKKKLFLAQHPEIVFAEIME